jgi:tripartite-type tricarboxylate transporter receptor subunit TctC
MKISSLVLALMLMSTDFILAQDSFFKGKTVRIVVPFAAGGGYDIYSRIIGRHMGKYIPGIRSSWLKI